MLIESFRGRRTTRDFDPGTGNLGNESTTSPRSGQKNDRTRGFYDTLGDNLIVLYREENELYLHVKHHTIPFRLHTIIVDDVNARRNLSVCNENGCEVCRISYKKPIPNPPLEFNWAIPVDEEDLEFGLFLATVSKDYARQDRLFCGDE